LSAALQHGHVSADVLWGHAIALDQIGRHEEAVADCSEAIAIDPNHAKAYNSRGVVRMKIGQIEEARADFQAGILLAPGWAGPFVNRAQLAHSIGELGSAIDDLTQAIGLIEAGSSPEEVELLGKLFWNRGIVRRARGDMHDAATDFKEAARRDPKLADR
jgi:tetratricopeptide (TPR) repeat protein